MGSRQINQLKNAALLSGEPHPVCGSFWIWVSITDATDQITNHPGIPKKINQFYGGKMWKTKSTEVFAIGFHHFPKKAKSLQ